MTKAGPHHNPHEHDKGSVQKEDPQRAKDQHDKDEVQAAALKYDPENQGAPTLVAKGKGTIAEEIIRIAEQEGVHIFEDPALAKTLNQLNLYEEIPPELYTAVAEVLAFVQFLEKKQSSI